ncbi:hypothetical protein GMSM_22820 [Geomonas sp. Red276]
MRSDWVTHCLVVTTVGGTAIGSPSMVVSMVVSHIPSWNGVAPLQRGALPRSIQPTIPNTDRRLMGHLA